MRFVPLFLLSLAWLTACSNPEEDKAAVRAAFTTYREALLSGDGSAALAVVDSDSLAYFAKLRDLALTAKAEQVKAEPPVSRIMVLLMRMRLTADELEKLKPEQLFAQLVEKGLVEKAGMERLALGPVAIEDGGARAEALHDGAPTGDFFEFHKVGGRWALSLVKLMQQGNAALDEAASAAGMTTDLMIVTIIGQHTGEVVPFTIWEPLR